MSIAIRALLFWIVHWFFSIGDHWPHRAEDFPVHGYIHHVHTEAPQYAIQSDKSRHAAYHKGCALRLVGGESQD
uniref:DUF2945 domain-containing protein n=1 Tax=Acidithiobacillus ferrianus TaxID=2678518 RepID=A0A845UDI5_9PROT|nr:DUF2945 domain-containing protein [Acidithiobacillus ferrianus]